MPACLLAVWHAHLRLTQRAPTRVHARLAAHACLGDVYPYAWMHACDCCFDDVYNVDACVHVRVRL